MSENTNKVYPRHDVHPDEKKAPAWGRQYAKAAYFDSETQAANMFWRAAKRYQDLRDMCLGKGSVDKFKPLLGIEEGQTESMLSIDWSNRPVIAKPRDISLSKIGQRQFRMIASPVDALGKTELDKWYHGLRAKLVARQSIMAKMQAAEQQGDKATYMQLQKLLQSPPFANEPGEPDDLEALEMKLKYAPKINVAIEAEKGIRLVFHQNDIDAVYRKKVNEDLFDLGVGGYKEWLDANGMVQIRAIEPSNMLVSNCRRADFADAVHMGELIEVPLAEISQYFSKDEMEIIVNANKGKLGNPAYYGDNATYNELFDGFKCMVLDLEILSDDIIVYEKRVDKRGNLHVGKGDWKKRNSDAKVVIDGKEKPKFEPRTITNIYKVKWVVGTDLVYEYGLAHNMKREPSKKLMGRTTFSYHLEACNFNNMRCESMAMRLEPLYNDYMLTHFKLQSLKNRMIPNGWAIDLESIEGANLSKGGVAMSPEDVLDMFFQSGILVYRGSQIDQNNPNRKPIEAIQNSYSQEFVALAQELVRIEQQMTQMIGLNVMTDASSPSDRMLNGVAAMAQQATNNALYRIMSADKHLLVRTAKGVVQRLQIAVKTGNVEGIIKGLGSTTVEHISVTKAIAPHIWGIMIDDIPTDEERMAFLQSLNLKDAQGQIDPEDLVTAWNIDNLKELREFIAYKIKKRREQAQQDAIRQQQENTKSQIDSAKAAEEAKQQTAILNHKIKMKEIDREKGWDYVIKKMEQATKQAISDNTNATAMANNVINNGTKAAMGMDPIAQPQAQQQYPDLPPAPELSLDDMLAGEPEPDEDVEGTEEEEQIPEEIL